LGLVAAALPLLVAGAFVAVPRISSALIVRPIDQPVATGAFACADLDGGPTIPVVDANGNSPRQASRPTSRPCSPACCQGSNG
jgi:hypothetical protein